jgi:Family of unknown function (DUF6428)
MKLSAVKKALESVTEVNFRLPQGSLVPPHFHVTEVGEITKHFIDCGGTVRHERTISFQLWEANDIDHRLKPKKLTDIITLAEKTLGFGDLEVEVEYQADTIGKYGLEFYGKDFVLVSKQTSCLAEDQCGIPQEKTKVNLSSLITNNPTTCKPGSGCC